LTTIPQHGRQKSYEMAEAALINRAFVKEERNLSSVDAHSD
jgi:hypothetical protein